MALHANDDIEAEKIESLIAKFDCSPAQPGGPTSKGLSPRPPRFRRLGPRNFTKSVSRFFAWHVTF
jgi:hypothetical protein